MLKFSEVPEIDIELINTKDEVPLGVGEVTAGPTAAAIGNAVSHALGARIRDLPLTRERIMATLLKELKAVKSAAADWCSAKEKAAGRERRHRSGRRRETLPRYRLGWRPADAARQQPVRRAARARPCVAKDARAASGFLMAR